MIIVVGVYVLDLGECLLEIREIIMQSFEDYKYVPSNKHQLHYIFFFRVIFSSYRLMWYNCLCSSGVGGCFTDSCEVLQFVSWRNGEGDRSTRSVSNHTKYNQAQTVYMLIGCTVDGYSTISELAKPIYTRWFYPKYFQILPQYIGIGCPLWVHICGLSNICSVYCKISNISPTKSQNSNASSLGLQLPLRNILKPCVKWRMQM